MDYNKENLEQDSNPIAIVILASQEKKRAKRKGEKFNIKLYLIRKLYDKGYGKDEIKGLFDFIDWVLQLNDEEEKLIWEEIRELEEVNKMPYVTSVERIGIAKGLQQGLQEGLQQGLQGLQQGLLEDGRIMIGEALDERFGRIPATISNAVKQVKDRDVLKFLLRQVIRCNSMEEFKQVLNRQN